MEQSIKQVMQNEKNRSESSVQRMPTHALCAYEHKMRQIVVQKYGTIDKFMIAMSPTQQVAVAQNRQEFIVGDFPTLNNIASAYGRTAPIQWLIAQIINLSEFCGVKDKLTGDQAEELAWLLAGDYSYYKVTQFLVFFHDFKMGKFGKFFGSVDPLVITTAIREFDKERIRIIAKQEQEEERRRLDEEAKNAITYQEWLAMIGDEAEEEKVKCSADTMQMAMSIVSNSYKVNEHTLATFRKLFIKNNECTPEEYIEKFAENDENEKQND